MSRGRMGRPGQQLLSVVAACALVVHVLWQVLLGLDDVTTLTCVTGAVCVLAVSVITGPSPTGPARGARL